MFGCLLSDLFTGYCKCEVYIIGDETYGACCIEDEGAFLLGADFLIHYGSLNSS